MVRTALALALGAPLALTACAGDAFRADAAATPLFRPDVVFAGEMVGTGTLTVIGRRAVAVSVESRGRALSDGSFRLRQRVTQGAKPTRIRTWTLRPAGDGRWTGSLTDATGPVEAMVHGNLFHVRYDGNGVGIEQWLYLQPDGRTVKNTLVARKMGVTVAELTETIRKVG